MSELSRRQDEWRARWYLWDGGFLTLGRGSAVVAAHAHHGIQLTLSLDGSAGLASPGLEPVVAPGLIVTANVPHELHTLGALLSVILVDPETAQGRWLARSYEAGISVLPEAKTAAALDFLRRIADDPGDASAISAEISGLVRSVCAGPPPLKPLDDRIRKALEVIRGMDTSKISLEEVAGAVFLSPSRFAHLFSAEVGLPFRRYVLWRRLTRAMLAVGRGRTLTAAAHECGFADSAHLTRACYQMLGLPPSVLLKAGEYWEVPGMFEVV